MKSSDASHDRALLVTLLVAAVLLLGGGGYLVYRVAAPARPQATDDWEREVHPKIVQLKSEGEALAIAGRLPEAHEKYRQIMLLVAGHSIKDPLLFDEVEQCKTDQDRIYAVILKTMEQKVAPNALQAQTEQTQSQQQAYPRGSEALQASSSSNTDANPQAGEGAVAAPIAASQPATAPQVDVADVAPASTSPSASAFHIGAKRKIPAPDGATDEQVGESMKRSVDFLLALFEKDHITKPPNVGDMSETEFNGLNALCVFALLHASQSMHDDRLNVNGPFMRAALERLKRDVMGTDANTQAPVVYAKSLRCAALAVYNRPEDRNVLKADVRWLVNVASQGAYTYDDRFNRQKQMNEPMNEPEARGAAMNFEVDSDFADVKPQLVLFHGKHNPDGSEPPGLGGPPSAATPRPRTGIPPPAPISRRPAQYPSTQSSVPWDNSNSQFGLLGVWSGAECGVEVPMQYWQAVQKHWTDCQLDTGQWTYDAIRTTPSYGMTVGGLASLFVTHDYIDTPMHIGPKSAGRDPFTPALSKGLAYLDSGDNSVAVIDGEIYYLGYNLFGLERTALASGFKFFGRHDWFRTLATRVIPLQWPNGSFGRSDAGFDTVADTAFTLVFFARGRHPIFINKLKFDGSWSNRPYDIANLNKFARRETERPMNWQVVGIDRDWRDWSDAAVLYIASHQPPKIWAQDLDKIRAYAMAGGLVFTHADSDSASFNLFAEDLARRLFPEYEMRDVPPDDLMYTGQYRIKPPLPKLRGVFNGSRWLMIHSPKDINTAWQTRAEKIERKNFEIALNTFAYATGGMVDLPNRLASTYIPAPQDQPGSTITFVRLQHGGNWDPEPFAWQRFARWLQWETDIGLNITAMKIGDLKPGSASVAHLSGTYANACSDGEIATLRAFVESGGTLLIESVGGDEAFRDSVQKLLLPKLLNGQAMDDVKPEHPLLAGGAEGLEKVQPIALRAGTTDRQGASPTMKIATIGKGRVIFTPLDLTSGLLGVNSMGMRVTGRKLHKVLSGILFSRPRMSR